MENGENITKQINKFYSGFEDCSFNLSSIFNRLNKKVEKLSMDNEILKKKYETIKVECETLKVDNKKLNDRVMVLENGYKDLKMHLKCPITECLMKSPVITPYGNTYEESGIKNWLKKSNTDPLNRAPLTEAQLFRNIGLENVYNHIKKKKEKK